ncbi:hypothetical protein [Actinosynnema sp. NPDC020468]|uniref:hypothetical protein n=1 Tax=Actinosynnema sp. NPDC020468 TaxID=3154488 RepID=UPI0033D005D1
MVKRIASVLGALALVASAALLATPAAQAEPSSAALPACYDHAHNYSKPSGEQYYPATGYLTTTSYCGDINIRPTSTRHVAVCFKPSSGAEYCNSYKSASGGQWTVVASDVKDGTRFYFAFSESVASGGSWAA